MAVSESFKNSFLIIFFLACSCLFIGCQSDPYDYARKHIRGTWKLDSIETFMNDSLTRTSDLPYFVQFSKEGTQSCLNGMWTDAPYVLDKITEEKVGLVVIVDGDSTKSTVRFIDKDHLVLIREDLPDPNGSKDSHWYHSRSSETVLKDSCVEVQYDQWRH